MIEVQGLSKHYGSFRALSEASFQAGNGQITGLLGPNGAGKTTCLRSIYGLLQADGGQALIDGLDASQQPLAARQRIGIFPDKFGLYDRLTTREHILYYAQLHGLQGEHAREAVAGVIQQLALTDIADRRAAGFSQGQRMKVALGQALVHQPANLILDEPGRGLDVMSTRILRQLMRQLRDSGHCILFSSHMMQEVAALCDQVVVMGAGRVVAAGSPEQLCEQTGQDGFEDAFVALVGTEEGIMA